MDRFTPHGPSQGPSSPGPVQYTPFEVLYRRLPPIIIGLHGDLHQLGNIPAGTI